MDPVKQFNESAASYGIGVSVLLAVVIGLLWIIWKIGNRLAIAHETYLEKTVGELEKQTDVLKDLKQVLPTICRAAKLLFVPIYFWAAGAFGGPADAVVLLKSHGGSGTAIATGEGWTLILSCAHCFEGASRNKPIQVAMPHPAPRPAKRVGLQVMAVGRTESVDLSLIKLNAGPVPYVSPVAPLTCKPKECWSIGFDELAMPAQCRPAKIVRLEGTRYLTDARPWHGRSGGALIDKQSGGLVGVVSAYTGPKNHAEYHPGANGVYVSLPAIHQFLVKAGVMQSTQPLPDLDGADPSPQFRRADPFGGPCPGGVCPIPYRR